MAIWKGAVKDVIWPEGPHIYKIGEYYYLMHAEGGTGPEHSISVARSKELFKWFEGCPRNPIFTHRNLGMDYPVIYAGHGDLVDDGKGNWYVVMLASRPCMKHSSMGRETFLAKVTWENGWPVIAPGVGHLEDEVEIPLDEYRFPKEAGLSDYIDFWSDELDDRLVGIGKRDSQIYSLTERKGMLRLYNREQKITELTYPSYLALRQKSYHFEIETGVDFAPENENETAGIVLFQNHENNLRVEICRRAGKRHIIITSCIHADESEAADIVLPDNNNIVKIKLRCESQKAVVWTEAGEGYVMAAQDIDLLPYTTEEAGGFVGCTVGMYASSNGASSSNHADFGWLSMQTL